MCQCRDEHWKEGTYDKDEHVKVIRAAATALFERYTKDSLGKNIKGIFKYTQTKCFSLFYTSSKNFPRSSDERYQRYLRSYISCRFCWSLLCLTPDSQTVHWLQNSNWSYGFHQIQRIASVQIWCKGKRPGQEMKGLVDALVYTWRSQVWSNTSSVMWRHMHSVASLVHWLFLRNVWLSEKFSSNGPNLRNRK